MTSSTEITYISSGGTIVFSPNSDYWLTDIAGLETSSEMSVSANIQQCGETLDSQYVSGRKLTFTGDIHGELTLNREKLLGAILPAEKATITFKCAEKEYAIDGYPTRTPSINFGEGMQDFQFEFYAPYPYFRTRENTLYSVAGITAKWQTPFFMQNSTYISQYNQNAFVSIINSGNVKQAFVLNIYARESVKNPTLYNITSSGAIHINKTLQKGERIRISTHGSDKDSGNAVLFYTSDGEEQNAFRYILPTSDLDMLISPGTSIFMASAQENKENMQCTIVTAGGEYHSI